MTGRERTGYTEITLATWNVQTMLNRGRMKTQERTGRGSRKRSSSAGSEKMERDGDRKKNGRIVCDRPKPTAGCSANGRRRTKRRKRRKRKRRRRKIKRRQSKSRKRKRRKGRRKKMKKKKK